MVSAKPGDAVEVLEPKRAHELPRPPAGCPVSTRCESDGVVGRDIESRRPPQGFEFHECAVETAEPTVIESQHDCPRGERTPLKACDCLREGQGRKPLFASQSTRREQLRRHQERWVEALFIEQGDSVIAKDVH